MDNNKKKFSPSNFVRTPAKKGKQYKLNNNNSLDDLSDEEEKLKLTSKKKTSEKSKGRKKRINKKKLNLKEKNKFIFNGITIFNKINIYKIICFLYIIIFIKYKNYNLNKNNNDFYFEETNFNQTISNFIKLKKVVYTSIIGNYDKLKFINKQEGWDYIAFIEPYNSDQYKDTNWTVLPIPEDIKNLEVNNEIKKQRYIKTHPHLLFKDYYLSLYIDGSCSIIGDINQFVLRIIKPKYYIYMVEHPDRNSIYEEFKGAIKYKKEKKNMIQILYNRYIKENFPKDFGLVENNVIIRRHNEKECIELMEEWWKEIKSNSHRDQLSFNYVLWKTGKKIKYIPKAYLYDYFSLTYLHYRRRRKRYKIN